MPLHRLVIHRVPLPSARVPRAVDAAPVRRRHLEFDANRANFVLLAPGTAEASEARCQRRVRKSAALVGSGRCGDGGRRGGGGLPGLTLRLQGRQRLTDLPGAHFQVWLLRPQLGEQRLGAEAGIRQPQSADGLQEAVGHAESARTSGDPHTAYRQTSYPKANTDYCSTYARRVRRCSNTWATTTTTGLQEGKWATSPKLASGARPQVWGGTTGLQGAKYSHTVSAGQETNSAHQHSERATAPRVSSPSA
eukprot:scaffold35986_cov58-Phaeocystis_antarctica.AAC.2